MGRKVQIVRVWVRVGSRRRRTVSYYSGFANRGKVIVMKYVGQDDSCPRTWAGIILPYTKRARSGIIPAT